MTVRHGHGALPLRDLGKCFSAVAQSCGAFKIKIFGSVLHLRNDIFSYLINIAVQHGADFFAQFFEFFFVHPVLAKTETTPDMIVQTDLFPSVFRGTVRKRKRL